MTVLNRPILVWVMVLFFGVPAMFYLLGHALILAQSLHASRDAHLDVITIAINSAEALFLVVAMTALFAMKRAAFQLCVAYFSIDLAHNLSGRYVDEPTTAGGLAVTTVISVAAVIYVWYLRRKAILN